MEVAGDKHYDRQRPIGLEVKSRSGRGVPFLRWCLVSHATKRLLNLRSLASFPPENHAVESARLGECEVGEIALYFNRLLEEAKHGQTVEIMIKEREMKVRVCNLSHGLSGSKARCPVYDTHGYKDQEW